MRRCTNPLIALLICATSLAFGATFREITDTGPWGDYEAFPDVCRMANGDLYVVFYAGLGHVTNPSAERPKGGAIYGLRSSDQGATWSEPILVVDTGEDDRDPHVTQLSNGDLIVSYFTSRYYTEDDKRKRDCDVFVVTSSDGGDTWSEPVHVDTPYSDMTDRGRTVYVSGPVMQLKGSHVALPIYHGLNAGHFVTAVVHSDDYGKTWNRAVTVDEEASVAFSYGFCEASMTRLGDGRLIIVMRPGMHVAYSDDEGYTWSKAEKLPHPGDAPTVFRTSKGMLLIAHRTPGTALTISPDDGKTWGAPWPIDTVGGAYPGLAELEDGSIICIYYEEGKGSDIRQAIFSVEPGIRLADLAVRFPPAPPPGKKLDLPALHGSGRVEIQTDMTHTEKTPGGGPTAVFDGNTEYLRAAWKAAENQDATYALKFADEHELTGLGICLKTTKGATQWPESADVYVSLDGEDWGKPVASFVDLATARVEYTVFDTPVKARFVKVHITKASGWPSLNELELYEK